MRQALVIGLGRGDQGDDGVGPAVTARLRALGAPVTVIEETNPAGLMEDWEGSDLVVVADAVRSGRPPGTVHVLHAGHGPLGVGTAPTSGGTHALGLADMVELARVLGRMPADLVVVGVEAEHFRAGEPMSEPVRAAVATAVRVVTAVVATVAAGQ